MKSFAIIFIWFAFYNFNKSFAEVKSEQLQSKNKELEVLDLQSSKDQWIKTQKADGSTTTYIHRDSVSNEKKLSYFSIYSIDAKSTEIVKLMKELQSDEKNRDKDLSPANCFVLNRKDLQGKQTWCQKNNDDVVAFVEEGEQSMKENQRTEIILENIFGRLQ